MTSNTKRGGARPGAGRPKGPTAGPKAKRITFRFYPDELAAIDALVEAGYGSDRTDVLRRAIKEAGERLS